MPSSSGIAIPVAPAASASSPTPMMLPPAVPSRPCTTRSSRVARSRSTVPPSALPALPPAVDSVVVTTAPLVRLVAMAVTAARVSPVAPMVTGVASKDVSFLSIATLAS